MIILKEGEKLRRRYPGDLKGYGKGTLYVTDGRLAFETEKHGLVMDIAFKYMMDWNAKGKRTLAFRWQEPPVQGADAQIADPMFGAEVELGRKEGSRCDPEEAKLALTLAYVEHFPYGVEGMGFYTNEKGELMNHFDRNGRVYNGGEGFDPDARWTLFRARTLDDMVRMAGGDPEKLDAYTDRWDYIREHGGKTLIEQELFAWLAKKDAQERDGYFVPEGGIDPRSMKYDGSVGQRMIKMNEDAVEACEAEVKDDEKEIRRCVEEHDLDGLTKILPPSSDDSDNPHKWRGGTIEEALTFDRERYAIHKRTLEILQNIRIDFLAQYNSYDKQIHNAVAQKVMAGEDVSNYVPEFIKIESALPDAEKKIEAHKKMLVEAV